MYFENVFLHLDSSFWVISLELCMYTYWVADCFIEYLLCKKIIICTGPNVNRFSSLCVHGTIAESLAKD